MGRSVKVYSARKSIEFFKYKNTYSELPKISRAWLAITDGRGALALNVCISPLTDFPNTIGKLVLPGTFVAEGENPKTALQNALRRDFGANFQPEYFSEVGPLLWHKGRNKDGNAVVFCEHLFATIGTTNIHCFRNNEYLLFRTIHETRFTNFREQQLHQQRVLNSVDLVMNQDDGRLGVMPVILLEAFAACNIIKRNHGYVPRFDVVIDTVTTLEGCKETETLNGIVTWSNKFIGFSHHANTLHTVKYLTNLTGKPVVHVC